MNIGLDWDDTFTRDPIAWAAFCKLMTERGHKVYIVTWRYEGYEAEEVLASVQYWKLEIEGVYCTGRKAKQSFMFGKGICIDVMIDDTPHAWIRDMEM